MEVKDYDNFEHFNSKEFHCPQKMDFELIDSLNLFRQYIQRPIQILKSFGIEGQHSPNSYHYFGRAVDIRIKSADIKETLGYGLIAPFGGMGLYFWEGHEPFMHLDNRLISDHRATWISYSPDEYIYDIPKALKRLQSKL